MSLQKTEQIPAMTAMPLRSIITTTGITVWQGQKESAAGTINGW
jgi:hypothetical protein